MTQLFNAMNSYNARTANGAITHSTSNNVNLDLFSIIGSARKMDEAELELMYRQALFTDSDQAIRTLLWARDIRGGAGERKVVRHLMTLPETMEKINTSKFMNTLIEVGRWDDVLKFLGTPMEETALDLINKGLMHDRNGLCAKWMPRERKPQAKVIRKALGMSPKGYRKTIANLSKTVEQNMCDKEWNAITYEHVPSKAALIYRNAFKRHDTERYTEYLEALTKGETKVNANAVFPYEVVAKRGEPIAEAMWKSLPNYMEGSKERIIPMVDVSGSMWCMATGNTSCLDIAVSLGMYISERNESIFKDQFLTFSDTPEMVKVVGNTLREKYSAMERSNWGFSTNICGAFMTMLVKAQQNNVPVDQMPTTMLILSDMEFNPQFIGRGTNFEAIRKAYQLHGYQVPKIVFWNLNGRKGNSPVKSYDTNTALVSGFSPAILKSVLGAKEYNPTSIMLDTIMKDRYNWS